MSKYDPLWEYLETNGQAEYKLSYAEIKKILGFNIDHSFLTYKREARAYGYTIGKISLKDKTIIFSQI